MFGSPSAAYISPSELPRVESMRPDKARSARKSGSGTVVYGGLLGSLDTNADTKGNKWYGSLGNDGISAKMLRNAHVSQSVGYVVNPLRAATWRFKPASGSELDREVAAFLSYCFLERLPWSLILERMVGSYVADGFALSEMTDAVMPIPRDRFPRHPGNGNGLVPTALHEIPNNTVDHWYKSQSDPTQLASIDQWQPYSDGEKSGYRSIPADRIIRITAKQKGGNFAGIPILRGAYGPWKLLDAFERFRAIGLERTAVGTPVATAPDGEFDKDEAESIELLLENMRTMAKGAMVLPGGYTLKWEGAGENDIENLNIAIEALKTDIAVNVTCGFSRLGLVGPGSYALANTQEGQYHLSTVGHAGLVSIAFTLGLDGWSPVARIVEANYGAGTPLPTLEARNLPTRDIKTILPLIYNGIGQGAITADDPLEEEIREMVQVGPHDAATARAKATKPAPTEKPESERDAA